MLGVLVTLCAAGALYESRAGRSDAKTFPVPGQMVDVGGYRLHINCIGHGTPAFVIDAGLGEWSTSWSLVQPEIGKITQTCTYDRAGYAWSEPGPQPRTSAEFSRELYALLANAGVPAPYVLVGHSLGGLTMQVFAHEYPAEVVGLVLVDSMSPGERTRPSSEVHTPNHAPLALGLIVRAISRLGIARILAGPIGLSPDALSPMATKASVAMGVRQGSLQTFLDESRAIPENIAQAAEVRSLGDLPVTVLSRAVSKSDAGWQAKQSDLLRLSTRSVQIVSESSGHAVQWDQPSEVVAAVADLVSRLR